MVFERKSKGLDQNQLIAILHFANTPIIKTAKPSDGSKFIIPSMLVAEWNIEPDTVNNGYWLKLGAYHEFIANNPEAGLLVDTPEAGRSIEGLLTKSEQNWKRPKECD